MNVYEEGPTDRPLGEGAYRRLLDAATEVLTLLVDLEGQIAFASAGSRTLLGLEPEELLGRRFDELLATGLTAETLASFRQAKPGGPQLRCRGLARRVDGADALLRFDAAPVPGADGEVEGVVVTLHEVDGERVADRLMSDPPRGAREEASGALIDRLPAVVYVAEPGADGHWQYVSPRIEQLLGFSREEWIADPTLWASRVHTEDLARVLEEEGEDAAAPFGARDSEYRMIASDGRVIWVRDRAVLRVGGDGVLRYDGLLIDITDRKRRESQLQFFADHDQLTGLPNRRRFVSELDLEIRRVRRHDQPVCLLMLDLDHLKDVNDSLGHRVGDELIRGAAEAVTARLRESDTVARLGGDEFAILARGARAPEAAEIATDLVEAIREVSRSLAPALESTGASVGVAELRSRFQAHDDALAAADRAMYEAKRQGGGRVQIHAAGAAAEV